MTDTPEPALPPATPRRACPVCGRREGSPRFRKGRLQVVGCPGCGMLYADPIDPELASGEFYDRLGLPFYLSPDKLEGDYAPVRFERELRLFRRYCRGGEVLDVGCSSGAFLFQLRSRFPGEYAVTGMDVAGAALDHAESRGIPVRRGAFLDEDFGSRRFDAVTFWAVLEHLAEPGRFLERAAALLQPGGCCFLLVPNMGSFAVRLLGTRYRYILPDHVNYFTRATLRRLVAGVPALSVVREGTSHFNPVVLVQDWRHPTERVGDAERARLLRRTTAAKQSGWLMPLRWVYRGVEGMLSAAGLADNLVAVARRIGD